MGIHIFTSNSSNKNIILMDSKSFKMYNRILDKPVDHRQIGSTKITLKNINSKYTEQDVVYDFILFKTEYLGHGSYQYFYKKDGSGDFPSVLFQVQNRMLYNSDRDTEPIYIYEIEDDTNDDVKKRKKSA